VFPSIGSGEHSVYGALPLKGGATASVGDAVRRKSQGHGRPRGIAARSKRGHIGSGCRITCRQAGRWSCLRRTWRGVSCSCTEPAPASFPRQRMSCGPFLPTVSPSTSPRAIQTDFDFWCAVSSYCSRSSCNLMCTAVPMCAAMQAIQTDFDFWCTVSSYCVGKRSSPARLPHSMNGGSDRAAFIIAQSPAASPASACSGGAGACVVPPPFCAAEQAQPHSVSHTPA
jgi:hypothetical protein